MASTSNSVTLTRHRQTPTDVVRGVSARVRRSADGTLALTFVLEADLGKVRIPPPRPSQLVHGLWEHTCFEAFVAVDGACAYHEFNFAPSNEWMMYAFRDYRDVLAFPDEMSTPDMTVRRAADQLDLDVALRLDTMSATHTTAPLRLALAAVVEEEPGRLSYWALRHPAGKPDFHHADAFALTIEAPRLDSIPDPR